MHGADRVDGGLRPGQARRALFFPLLQQMQFPVGLLHLLARGNGIFHHVKRGLPGRHQRFVGVLHGRGVLRNLGIEPRHLRFRLPAPGNVAVAFQDQRPAILGPNGCFFAFHNDAFAVARRLRQHNFPLPDSPQLRHMFWRETFRTQQRMQVLAHRLDSRPAVQRLSPAIPETNGPFQLANNQRIAGRIHQCGLALQLCIGLLSHRFVAVHDARSPQNQRCQQKDNRQHKQRRAGRVAVRTLPRAISEQCAQNDRAEQYRRQEPARE